MLGNFEEEFVQFNDLEVAALYRLGIPGSQSGSMKWVLSR